MDKRDQHDNPVGDELNLSPENQLPSIWDNISKELNALDEASPHTNTDDPDHSDVDSMDDFSIIKDSFQKTFCSNQPPKFMWDKIEQDLESFTVTDAPSDFSAIKAGFEQIYKENTAPTSVWEDLEEEMDNPKPKTKEEDYGFVKAGFEKKYSAVVVPLFSWEDLAERMDYEAELADTPDKYSIIKESFEKEFADKKPIANIWADISQELSMGMYWSRFVSYFSSIVFNRKTALLVLLGMLIGGDQLGLFEYDFVEEFNVKPIALQNQKKTESSLLSFEQQIFAGSPLYTPWRNTSTILPPLNKPLLQPNNAQQPQAMNSNQSLEKPSVVKAVEKGISEKSNNTTLQTSNLNVKAATLLEIENAGDQYNNTLNSTTAQVDSLSMAMEHTKGYENEKNIDLIQAGDPLEEGVVMQQEKEETNWSVQDGMEIELLEDGMGILVQKYIEDPAIAIMEENSFPLVRQAQKGRKIRFEMGLISRGGTSLFVGENLNKAFNSKNPSAVNLCPTGAVGLMFNYHFNLNDAVVLGVYPYATAEQCFRTSTLNGTYDHKVADLSFFDMTIGYQRTLAHYNTLGKAPSRIYTRLDVGIGYLTSEKTTVNDELVQMPNLYNKWNVSLGLALGSTHEIDQLVIDYGFFGDMGITDLVTLANTSVFQPAKLLNVGVYVGVRYMFFPRLEPSKAQRQFDWSPPFYIEEPAF